MSEPDIVVNIPGTDLQSWIWIQEVHITRNGTEVCPGTEDKWRIGLPLRASLARNGELILDEDGKELPAPCKMANVSMDVARYIHHPEVQALLVALRDTAIRIARGTLTPSTPPPSLP